MADDPEHDKIHGILARLTQFLMQDRKADPAKSFAGSQVAASPPVFDGPLQSIPKTFIFVGDLALRSTLYHHDSNRQPFQMPCRLLPAAGYVRDFCCQDFGRCTRPVVRPAAAGAGEEGKYVTGTLVDVDLEKYQEYIAETNAKGKSFHFKPRPLSRECLEAIGWCDLPQDVDLYINCYEGPHNAPSKSHPISQSRMDDELLMLRSLGDQYVAEVLESTHGWSVYWLQDRNGAQSDNSCACTWVDTMLKAHVHNFGHRQEYMEYSTMLALEAMCDIVPEDTRAKLEAKLQAYRSCAHAEEAHTCSTPVTFQGPLNNQPTNFIFGFGSLINTASRMASDPSTIYAVPVRLSAAAGYIRCWNFQSPTAQLTALGLQRVDPGLQSGLVTPSSINGVVYPIIGDDMEAFDEREEGYTRMEIAREHLTALSWQSLPEGAKIWLYVPNGPQGVPGVGLKPASRDHPYLQTYIDTCLNGCLEYGEDFAIEFLETTHLWNQYWLNDRALARRPWVNEKNYKRIDKLLARHPAGGKALHRRSMESDYAQHVLKDLFLAEPGDSNYCDATHTHG